MRGAYRNACAVDTMGGGVRKLNRLDHRCPARPGDLVAHEPQLGFEAVLVKRIHVDALVIADARAVFAEDLDLGCP